MGWWSKLWRKKAEDWTYGTLSPSQVPDPTTPAVVPKEEAYLNVWLKSMRVVNVRKGLKRFYGTVHSHITLLHLNEGEVVVQTVTTPGSLKDVNAKNIDRVVSLNHRLLGPVPFRGGDVEFEVGLFSVKSADLAAPFIELIGNLANTAGVSAISTAMPFVQPIKTGIELLTSTADDSILEIGLARAYNPIKTGWFVVMRAPKKTVDISQLQVSASDFKLTTANGQPVKDHPYMVFSIDVTSERDDWFLIPALVEPYRTLQEAVRSGKVQDAEEAFGAFRLAILTSPDLLRKDAKRLVEKVKSEMEDIMGTALTSAKTAELPDLRDINLYGK